MRRPGWRQKPHAVIVRYTPYALSRMEQRHVSEREVEAVLAGPEFTLAAKDGRQKAWAQVKDGVSWWYMR